MNLGYIPKLSMNSVTPSSAFQSGLTGQVRKLEMPDGVEAPNFKQALGSLVENVNATMEAPDALMNKAMTGESVDVHDVMIANSKADILLSVTTQTATKVIQAYDKILQIQI